MIEKWFSRKKANVLRTTFLYVPNNENYFLETECSTYNVPTYSLLRKHFLQKQTNVLRTTILPTLIEKSFSRKKNFLRTTFLRCLYWEIIFSEKGTFCVLRTTFLRNRYWESIFGGGRRLEEGTLNVEPDALERLTVAEPWCNIVDLAQVDTIKMPYVWFHTFDVSLATYHCIYSMSLKYTCIHTRFVKLWNGTSPTEIMGVFCHYIHTFERFVLGDEYLR